MTDKITVEFDKKALKKRCKEHRKKQNCIFRVRTL